MKYSVFLAAASAALVVASPLRKRVMITDIRTAVVYVTVTAGDEPTSIFGPGAPKEPTPIITSTTSTTSSTPTSTSTTSSSTPPPPPPAPTTTSSSTPPPPPPATSNSIPEAAPAVVTVTAAQEPSSSPAPSVSIASSSPGAAQDTPPTPTDYTSSVLYYHNVHRANNSASGLTYDDGLAASAQLTANKCVFAHDMNENGGGYGQNLAMYASTDISGYTNDVAVSSAISEMWYNGEINSYPVDAFGPNGPANPDMGNFEAWGHFSQVVWAATTKVGCATVVCPAGTMEASMDSVFTVCDYSPPGNMGGAYGSNVLRPLGQATFTLLN